MTLYPIFLDLTDCPVLVVGGGRVAARKTGDLLESRACITVVAPECCTELTSLVDDKSVVLYKRKYQPEDVLGKRLVISAAGCEEINRQVYQDCKKHEILCNVVDEPQLCDFHVPARVRRGLLQIAVSTGGASPAMAKRIRKQLEEIFGTEYKPLMSGLMELREHMKSCGPADQKDRKRLLEAFLDSEAPELLLKNGDHAAFKKKIEEWKSKR